MPRDERAEALAAEAIKDRGYLYPEWRFVAEHDPDFMASYNVERAMEHGATRAR